MGYPVRPGRHRDARGRRGDPSAPAGDAGAPHPEFARVPSPSRSGRPARHGPPRGSNDRSRLALARHSGLLPEPQCPATGTPGTGPGSLAGGPDEDVYRVVTVARVWVLTPFPPRLDGTHGGSRAIAELLERVARRRPVALLALRSSDDPPIDPRLVTACDLAREITRSPESSGPRARGADLRVAAGLLRGVP